MGLGLKVLWLASGLLAVGGAAGVVARVGPPTPAELDDLSEVATYLEGKLGVEAPVAVQARQA